MNFIKNTIYGLIIGLANIIPGVSGGTMAVVLNVYDRLISSISNLKKSIKKNGCFLLAILLGAAIAILLFSKGITYLLNDHYMITNFFFIGIIIGSIPMIYNRATEDSFKPLHIIPCLITLAIMLVTVYFAPSTSSGVIITSLSVPTFLKLFFISALAAVCMIIPGISGSFVMLLFGVYETVTTAISDMNILVLIPIGFGALMGIILGSKVIEITLKRFPQATYFAILGFVFGSIPAIWDKIHSETAFKGGITLVMAIVVLILGALISYLFSNERFKTFIISKSKKSKI